MPINRYGFPGHLGQPYGRVADFEVNLLPGWLIDSLRSYLYPNADLRFIFCTFFGHDDVAT